MADKMTSPRYHIAQLNIARAIAPMDSPVMAEFVALLDEINALADHSPGFVWRLQDGGGNATYIRPFADDRILVNLSVWESVEHLKEFVYKSAHGPVVRRRGEWFEKFDGAYQVLWWVKAGEIPTVEEAKRRLDHLRESGESSYAFTFKRIFAPPEDGGEH